jgi:hypothetical protein
VRTVRAGLAALVAVLIVGACGSTTSPAVTHGVARSNGTASQPGTPLASLSGSGSTAPLDIHLVPQAWTTPLLDTATDGSEIIWSKGGDTQHGAPDIYAWTPGDPSPKLLVRGSDREAQAGPIAVHHGRYAFEEAIDHGPGNRGWRVWYIPAAGQKPLLVDTSATDPQSVAEVAPATWLALTDDRLIWNAYHQSPSGPRFYLRSFDFKTGTTRNLLEADAAQTQYWFPNADDEGRLVYSTIERSGTDPAAYTYAYHVFLAQVNTGPLQPRQLDKDGRATEPVLRGDAVVWKRTDGSVSGWGNLERFTLTTGALDDLDFDHQSGVDDFTVGNRFVAAWLPDDTIFEVYDLQTGTNLLIEQYAPTSPKGVVRPEVGGDLLTFIRHDNFTNLQLCWTRLPPPSQN